MCSRGACWHLLGHRALKVVGGNLDLEGQLPVRISTARWRFPLAVSRALLAAGPSKPIAWSLWRASGETAIPKRLDGLSPDRLTEAGSGRLRRGAQERTVRERQSDGAIHCIQGTE